MNHVERGDCLRVSPNRHAVLAGASATDSAEAAGFCHPVLIGTNCHPAGNPNTACAPGEMNCVCDTLNFSGCVDAAP